MITCYIEGRDLPLTLACAIDSLRQLALKFLEKDELTSFHFQVCQKSSALPMKMPHVPAVAPRNRPIINAPERDLIMRKELPRHPKGDLVALSKETKRDLIIPKDKDALKRPTNAWET